MGGARTLPDAISDARMVSLEVDFGASRPPPTRPQEKAVSAEPQQPDRKPAEEDDEPALIVPEAEERLVVAAAAARPPPAALLLRGDMSPSKNDLPPNQETHCLAQDWVVKQK